MSQQKQDIKTVIQFVFKVIVHYGDFATDYLLILDIQERSTNPQYSDATQFAYFQVLMTLCIALFAERLLTYFFLVNFIWEEKQTKFDKLQKQQNQKTDQKNEQIQKAKVSFCEKVQIFILVYLYGDYIYYLMRIKVFSQKKYLKSFRRHMLLECLIESFLFAAVGFGLIFEDLYFEQKINEIPVISGLTSLVSVVHGFRLYQIERERLKQSIKGKHEIGFNELSDESRLFILNIYQFQCLKENLDSFSNYKDLNVGDQITNQNGEQEALTVKQNNDDNNIEKNVTNMNNNNKIAQEETKNLKEQQTNKDLNSDIDIPTWKILYLWFYFIIAFPINLGFYLISLPTIFTLKIQTTNILSALIGIPQFILYMSEYFRQNKSFKKRISELIKGILFYPIHVYFTYLQIGSSVTTENIPIFSSFKETWTNNLYPSILKMTYKQIIATIAMYAAYQMMENKDFVADDYQKPEDKDRLINNATSSGSTYRILYEIQVYGYIFTTLFNLIYFGEWLQFQFFRKKQAKINELEKEFSHISSKDRQIQQDNINSEIPFSPKETVKTIAQNDDMQLVAKYQNIANSCDLEFKDSETMNDSIRINHLSTQRQVTVLKNGIQEFL